MLVAVLVDDVLDLLKSQTFEKYRPAKFEI